MGVGVEELGMQGGNFQGDNPELDVGERIYLGEADLCSFNMLVALFTNSTSTCRLARGGRGECETTIRKN